MLVSRIYDQNPRSSFSPFPVPGLASAWLHDRSQFSESEFCDGVVIRVPAGLPGCQEDQEGEGDEQGEDLFHLVLT